MMKNYRKLGIKKTTEPKKLRSGKVINKTSMFVDGEKIPLNQFASVVSNLHSKTDDKNNFESVLKDILEKDIKLGSKAVEARFDEIDFNNPASIKKNIALMNLYVMHIKLLDLIIF